MSEELVRQYEPIMRHTKGENFYPMSVKPYLAKCSLHHKDKKVGMNGMVLPPEMVDEEALKTFNSPGFYMIYAAQQVPDEDELARLKEWAETYKQTRGPMDELLNKAAALGIVLQRVFLPLDLPKEVHQQALENYGGPDTNMPTYHCRYVEMGGYQIIQYWFFYAYNDFASSFGGVNDHEADWEHIAVFLKEGKPVWTSYAAHHDSGEEIRRAWDAVEKVGTHPVVYVAGGSHASYYSKGEHHGIDKALGDGRVVGEGGSAWAEPANLDAASWANDYKGLWGFYAHERLSDKLLKGAASPAGPKYNSDGTVRKSWENPLTFAGLDK